MLLSDFAGELKFTLELDEFMKLATVEKLAERYLQKSHWDVADHSIRPVYGMSGVQTLFACVLRGNTIATKDSAEFFAEFWSLMLYFVVGGIIYLGGILLIVKTLQKLAAKKVKES